MGTKIQMFSTQYILLTFKMFYNGLVYFLFKVFKFCFSGLCLSSKEECLAHVGCSLTAFPPYRWRFAPHSVLASPPCPTSCGPPQALGSHRESPFGPLCTAALHLADVKLNKTWSLQSKHPMLLFFKITTCLKSGTKQENNECHGS